MYAIIESGNKQYKVEEGSVIDVELLDLADDKVVFDKVVLFVDGDKVLVGTPYLEKVKVKGTLLKEIQDDKVVSFKYKHKTGYHKTKGHRQKYSQVKIEGIK